MDIAKKNKSIIAVEVSRGTTHDGPGMRTTVFVKGCPLSCRWCQNPESINTRQEIWYDVKKCIGCSNCVKACINKALLVLNTDEHNNYLKILHENCTGCCSCTETCPAKAIYPVSVSWEMDDLVHEVLKDKIYYNEFKGGVTVSGGEPMLYPDFILEFFKIMKLHGVNTALDTSGYVNENTLMEVLPYTDILLYDIKIYDDEQHIKYTGKSNHIIHSNLIKTADYLRSAKHENKINAKKLWIRTPLIPECTATKKNISQIAGFLNDSLIDIIDRWELCSFNSACAIKYTKMQKPWLYRGFNVMGQNEIDLIKSYALSRGFPENKLFITGMVKNER